MLLLLEELGEVRPTEVSSHLGVASSTAHRLLAMLAWRGFIRQDSHTKAYMPGPSLARVAYSARRRNDLVASAQPIVDELSETLGETSHLGALEGTRVRYLIATESAAPVRVVSRVGKDYPAHATAVGKALLAGLTTEQLRTLYPREALEALTPATVATRTQLAAQLDRVRRVGYAVSRGESGDEGVAGVAVMVPNELGLRIAINVSAPSYRMPTSLTKSIAGELMDAAGRLSETLR
ncbi:IclR family transcriptional regulator [Microbacterium schleiferi]|nr:IclR family transcriptional regulator [Microbacterium schleiferi]